MLYTKLNFTFCVILSGVRPYKCDVCGVAFAQKNNLKRHMQVHNGAFTYKCPAPTCNFATKRREMLKAHMVHHGSLQYQCRLCSNAYFLYPGDLRKHIVKSHKNLGPEQQDHLALLGKLNDTEMQQNKLNAGNMLLGNADSNSSVSGSVGRWRHTNYRGRGSSHKGSVRLQASTSSENASFTERQYGSSFDDGEEMPGDGCVTDKMAESSEECIDLDEYEEDGDEEYEEEFMAYDQDRNFDSEVKQEILDSDDYDCSQHADCDEGKGVGA